MLNVGAISEGYVLDHITVGKAMEIYHYLELDKVDYPVAIIKNVRSEKMGKKDILKVECPLGTIDFALIGFLDDHITLIEIRDSVVTSKTRLSLPEKVRNVIKCKNPRCITSIEQGLVHEFFLADREKKVYRCRYCEEQYREQA